MSEVVETPLDFRGLVLLMVGAAGLYLAMSFFLVRSTAVEGDTDPPPGDCTVNWREPLGYEKPYCRDIADVVGHALPNESSSLKYWVDLSGGSGSTCSQASPCDSFSDLNGKPGTNGGPAYIYVKGSGAWADQALAGSDGNEIVIKPWDDATQATITGRNNWTTNKKYLVIDGGENLRIKYLKSGSGQFDPSIYLDASSSGVHSHLYFYRTDWEVTGEGEHAAMWGIQDNLWFLNSEFHSENATDQLNQHHLYFSGAGEYGAGATEVHIVGSIFRNTPGEAIEFRLFETYTNVYIEGSVFHDGGKGTCGNSSWHCRSSVTFGFGDGASYSGTLRVANNKIWDQGEGCWRTWENPGTAQFYNNTCIDWGQSSGAFSGTFPCCAALPSSGTGSPPGDFRNNILYATGNIPVGTARTPFYNNTDVDSFNACASGKNCGTSSQENLTSGSFVSNDEDDPDFLKLASGSTPIDNGTTLSSITVDYRNISRPQGAAYDIGAYEGAN